MIDIHTALIGRIRTLLSTDKTKDEKLYDVCKILSQNIEHYNWVGIYELAPEGKFLHLGPYYGADTDHTTIAVGRGVCGQVAELKKTIVVQDVRNEGNYLSCSVDVRSEIVVPIITASRFVAELDIDSHKLSPFRTDDTEFLEEICQILSVLYQ